MPEVTIKQNDTRTAIKAQLRTPKNTPVNLAGASVRFVMTGRAAGEDGEFYAERDAIIVDESAGEVAFTFDYEDVATVRVLVAEFKVEYPDGSIETFPNSGYIRIKITEDLAKGV